MLRCGRGTGASSVTRSRGIGESVAGRCARPINARMPPSASEGARSNGVMCVVSASTSPTLRSPPIENVATLIRHPPVYLSRADPYWLIHGPGQIRHLRSVAANLLGRQNGIPLESFAVLRMRSSDDFPCRSEDLVCRREL